MRFPVMSVRVLLRWTVVVSLASAISSREDYVNYLVTSPQNPQLQIGTNFTATCLIRNTTEVTSRDLRWKLGSQEISTDQYTKISETALNVTITVTTTTPGWLFCISETNSESVTLNRGKYTHGIFLRKGYFPIKPQNLTCVAVQDQTYISPILHCAWEPKHQQPGDFGTIYRLNVRVLAILNSFNSTTNKSSADIDLEVFPTHMLLEIWVEAENALGRVESERLNMEANSITKTNPPANVNTISEERFPTSLLLNWTRPIDKTQLNLIHEIRFAPEGSHTWSYVPQADTNMDIQSFRLQNLLPYTAYVSQVRCKNHRGGYWSEWSNNSTKRTPSSKPTSKPDVWYVMSESADGQQIQLLSKEPEFSNGKIIEYQISIQYKLPSKNAVWEKIPVSNPNADSRSKHVTLLKKINLNDKVPLIVKVTAVNSKGMSPVATMVILKKDKAFPPVQKLEVYPDAGKLFVEWTAPNNANVSEYLVQWTSGEKMDWQRETNLIQKTSIQGKLEKFVRYNVSVFPLYFSTLWIGKPLHVETYLEQAAPLDGPAVKLKGKPGCTEAHLVWEEIPLAVQRGYISNYTIYYSDGTETKAAATVGSDTRSYTLKELTHNTRYDVWLKVTNAKGSANGSNHSFTTLNYAPGEIEGIVVGVSLGFLFVVVLIMLICICKRDVIKENFWPQIPNPGASTIGTWTPDCHIKAETSSENCLSGISVLDVDVCDGKSVFEEDKACLPLKKDKYMSEEHSSGIGGSSCMSSPRQSVSDSDEGGDMADTTASTVQYSSVVASSGYKGQTPSLPSQPTVFSRSESTQPLLESEENTDMLSLEGSRHSQRFGPLSHCEGNSDSPNQLKMEHKTLDFCADGEDSEDRVSDDGLSHDWVATAPISSYMPQLGGYRPQ